MTEREALSKYVVVILDDAGGEVEEGDLRVAATLRYVRDLDWLFGWKIEGEWMGFSMSSIFGVAVRSHLPDVILSKTEALEIAMDWREERGWGKGSPDREAAPVVRAGGEE